MSLHGFNYRLEKVSPIISKCDTNFRDAMPAKVRLLLTLRFLANRDSYESLNFRGQFRVNIKFGLIVFIYGQAYVPQIFQPLY
nr:unnamed protein product [Callosobruchus analis]